MSNETIFGEEARKKLKRGVDLVFNSVAPTLGAKGRNAVFWKFGKPRITNDGVSIARGVDPKDQFEKIGAELIKEAAEKTNKQGGDGTTTATILARTIIHKGLEYIDQGVNAMALRREIEEAARFVVEEIEKMSQPVQSFEELLDIATISVESPEIGLLVAEAVDKGGKYGKVIVEESEKLSIEKEEVDGMLIESGWISPYMVTDPERMEARITNVPILVTDRTFHLAKDIVPVIEKIHEKGGKHLLLIAEDVTGEALQMITLNRLKGAFHTIVIKKPYYKESLEDIAVLTGATAITAEKGIVELKETFLGSAQSVVATEDRTIIAGGGGHESSIKERIEQLKKQLDDKDGEYDKEKLQERIAKLAGSVVIIRVGAKTDTEMKYLRDKIDDAVNSTRAAMEEGILPGGGKALWEIADKLRYFHEGSGKETPLGYLATAAACEAPLFQIIKNSGKNEVEIALEIESLGGNSGYDALEDEVVPDLLESGIIDPAKVTRLAIENATSLGAIFLTIDVVRAEIEDDKIKI